VDEVDDEVEEAGKVGKVEVVKAVVPRRIQVQVEIRVVKNLNSAVVYEFIAA
jgi:hypothetical protein